MKQLQGNCSFQSKISFCRRSYKSFWALVASLFMSVGEAQVANYVNNPGFEVALPNATLNAYDCAKYWTAIDSIGKSSHVLRAKYLGTVPQGFGGYQMPKSGDNFIVSEFYCDINTCGSPFRWYLKNRLKQILKPNVVYCAKYYVVNTNNCVVGIDSYGIYVGDATLDTIKYCLSPITYLNPQVQNQAGIITDTLNWTAISGTFVANGTEKYLVLGNFKSNALTNTLIINPTYLPNKSNDNLIDDVSLIEMDLPAYAGPDVSVIPGDSVFIGRVPDVEIDESCVWYKLPNMSTPIASVAGLYVKPIVTTTYVVKQQLWCSGVKYDTVVVHENPVGLQRLSILKESLILWPTPAQNELLLTASNQSLLAEFKALRIFNEIGQMIREEEIGLKGKTVSVSLYDIPPGVYFVTLTNRNDESVTKKLIVAKE